MSSRTVQVARPAPRKEDRAPARKTRVVVKKVGPWSMFRFSLLYYFCVMIVILIGLTVLYNILAGLGFLDSVSRLARKFGFGPQEKGGRFEIHGGWLLSRAFAVGVVMVVFWSLVKLFLTFVYNLISDLVGGVDVTLTERK